MPKKLSVIQLNNYIKEMFNDEMLLHNIEVFGEVQSFNISNNKTFITLCENGYILNCVKFGTLEKIAIGKKVLLSGSVTFFSGGGRISFNIKTLSLLGEGEEHLKLARIKETLKKEGYFEKGKELPSFVKSAAVITSTAGAVIHDIKAVLEKNESSIDLHIINSKVQGDNADLQILQAFNLVNENSGLFDCVILARGGGSASDLEIFNLESIARAVADCSLPVISAIGHETDYTLCDLCAKNRAATPSIAAQIICSINQSVFVRFTETIGKLKNTVSALFEKRQNRLYVAQSKIVKQNEIKLLKYSNKVSLSMNKICNSLYAGIEKKYVGVNAVVSDISKKIEKIITDKENRYRLLEVRLNKNNPLRILAQGYAKVIKNGISLSSVSEVICGDNVSVRLSDGEFLSLVKEVKGGVK